MKNKIKNVNRNVFPKLQGCVTDKIRELPNCDCRLHFSDDGTPAALIVGEKEKSMYSSFRIEDMMVIRPLDRVTVDVTSTAGEFNVLGSIQIYFVACTTNIDVEGNIEASSTSALSEVEKQNFPSKLSSEDNIKTPSSKSQTCNTTFDLKDLMSRKYWRSNKFVSSTRKNSEKVLKVDRRQVLMTGGFRMIFGDFGAKPAQGIAGQSGKDTERPSAGGYSHARQRMQEMGEVWAEEEDLPEQLSATDQEGATRNRSNNYEASANYGKLQHLATQRIGKLKAEKRSNKY